MLLSMNSALIFHVTDTGNLPRIPGFGDTIISYQIIRQKHQVCRLLVKILVNYPKGIPGVLRQYILPLGDLVMMRRQMINFKALCEKG